jgi:hypothetical protein
MHNDRHGEWNGSNHSRQRRAAIADDPNCNSSVGRIVSSRTEWSLAHVLRILRADILEATIRPESATKADLCQLLADLENYLNLAA